MTRKKRDFDYMELYNPDYRAMKANIFDGIVRDSHIETLSVPDKPMTNPFGQESAYNGTYKMDKLSYNDYDYQNMTPEAQQQFDAYNQQVKDNNKQYRQNQREYRQEARQQEGGGFGMWGNVINGAANNMITAFTDPNMKAGDRVATILGMPNLAKNWRADTTKGDANITEMTNRINNATNRLIQDSNDTQGAFAAIKNNNNLNLIDTSGFKTPTLKDFKGKWWKNTGVAMAQGAASGSIGGPWGAAGGAVTGLLGSIGGLFGRKGRAQRALDKYKDDMNYLQRFAGNFNSFQRLNQQQSNENLLNNGLKQQRIQDLANIRAYGGNLFDDGGSFDKDPLDEIPNGIWSTVNNSTNYVPTSDESTLTPAEQQKILDDWEKWKKENPKLYLAGNITPFIGTTFAKYDYLSEPSFVNALSATMSATGDAALFMPSFVNRIYQGLKTTNKLVRNPNKIVASLIGMTDDANDINNYYNENIDIQPTYESSYTPRQREVVPEYEGYMLPEVVVEGTKDLNKQNINAMGGYFDTFNLSPNMIDMQNQSLDNQKYKYINQMQPVGFTDGGAGKTPNPGIPRLACGGKLHLNKFDYGGSMSMEDLPENMQIYGNGGTHEENPNGGIQVGVDQQGTPNLVEQGEFRYGDYVFSDRINVDPELLTEFNLAPVSKGKKKKNESYADAAKKMVKKAGDLNDPITKDTIDANMNRLKNAQEAQKFKEQQDQQLADYKSALKTPTQGNPMYGSMKYNGMGDVNQGLNEGVDSGMGAMDNSSLSNVNRSGNEMMAAYGGNLYPDGGNIIISNQGVEFRKQPNGTWMSANGDTWSDAEMQQFVDNGDATMRPIHPAWGVANDIVNRMNTPSYGGSNSFETTPLYATPYFQLNPLGGLAGSGLATDTPLRDLGMQKTYPVIGYGEETGDIYMTPTGIRTSEQVLNQPTNSDYTPLTWNSQASNTMNPLYNIDVNLGFGQTQNGALGNGNIYNQQFGLGIRPDYVASKNPNKTVEAVSTYGKNVNGQIQYDPNGKPVMLYPNTFTGLNGEAANVDNRGFYQFENTQNTGTGASNPSYTSTGKSFSYSKTSGDTVNKDVNYKDDPLTISKDSTASGTTQNPQQSVNSLGDLQKLNAQYATGNPFDAPSYNTFGRHAAPLKFLPAAFADRMGLTNFDYDPNLRPNQELKATGRTGFVPRTDDHSGMYRNAELFDINAANNAAQAQAAATARAMRNVNDRNQGAANQLAADYNAMLGIGNNYQTMFDANMKSRLATDEYNKQTEQTNVAANNDMYKDNQNAGIQAKQMELNTLAQSMADQTQKELYADKTNREAHDNIAGTQTALWNNTMQHLMDEAKRNDLYNKFNSDASQMWYYDKKLGKYVFKGDPAQAYLGTAMRTAKNPVTSLDADLLKQYNDYVAKVGSQNVSKEFIDNLVYQQGQRNQEKEAKSIADRNAQMQSDIDFMNTQFQDLDNLTINDKDKSYKFFDYINSPKQVEAVRNFLANADVSQMNPNDYKNYKALLDNWMRMRDRQLMYRNQISPYNVADATNTTWVGQDNQAYGGYINSSKKKKKQYYTDI